MMMVRQYVPFHQAGHALSPGIYALHGSFTMEPIKFHSVRQAQTVPNEYGEVHG